MSDAKKKNVKVALSEALWYRLNYYATNTDTTPENAVALLLERYLPDLTGSLIKFLETLTNKEKNCLKGSFYTLMFLVACADDNASLRESLETEKQRQQLRNIFGERFMSLLALGKAEQQHLLERVQKFDLYDVIEVLIEMESVFGRMPETLREAYKATLLEAMFSVAQASKESLFSRERMCENELRMLCEIIFMLEIALPNQYRDVFSDDFYIILETRRKIKHRQMLEQKAPTS